MTIHISSTWHTFNSKKKFKLVFWTPDLEFPGNVKSDGGSGTPPQIGEFPGNSEFCEGSDIDFTPQLTHIILGTWFSGFQAHRMKGFLGTLKWMGGWIGGAQNEGLVWGHQLCV